MKDTRKHNKENHPPRIASAILSVLLSSGVHNGALGDLEERFAGLAAERGLFYARLFYWVQIPAALPGCIHNSIYWGGVMFRNYLIVAWRNITRHKLFSLINMAGLAIGMACFALILLWVQDELSCDRFHENFDRIHRVMLHYDKSGDYSSYGPGPLAPALKGDYPEIVEAARMFIKVTKPLKYGDRRTSGMLCGIERPFFDIFTFPFLEGNPDAACADPNFIILTESTALRLFPEEDPIGKTVSFEWWGRWLEFNVTGIVADVPSNSHLRFDYLLPFSFVTRSGMAIDRWDAIAYQAYVLLDEKVDPSAVSAKIGGTAKRHHAEADYSLCLQPLGDVSLRYMSGGGPIVYIYIFSVIAALILLIACINFTNLSTARSASRALEIGLRKVAGSNRSQLTAQFIGESIVIAVCAGVLAALIVYLLLPGVNTIAEKQLTFDLSGGNALSFALIIVITGVLAGIYPAIHMSRFKPTDALKGGRTSVRTPGLRKILIVAQFVVSIALIIVATTVHRQLSFIHHKDLGFKTECIINLEPQGDFYRQYNTIRNELLDHSRIKSITMTNFATDQNFSTDLIDWEGKTTDEEISLGIRSVDFEFQKTFGIEMVEGRFFSRDHTADASSAVIINEAAARKLGFDEPIDKRISLRLPMNDTLNARVIGVVKNFHTHSLRSRISPLVIAIVPYWFCDVYIGMDAEELPGTIAYIEDRLREIVPNYTFTYRFLDEQIASLYGIETRIGSLVGYGTILAILLSCMGLFGLSVFTAERRTKEIGIRKVLGSSIAGIVLLLSRELVKWVLLANVIAWPIAWLITHRWLEGFAYRISVDWYVFVFCGGAAFVIALITVGWQAQRSARANPVESLRYE